MHEDNKIEGLIYRYRMMGFDKPIFEVNNHFKCRAINVCDPCGQWKIIKGNSNYSCIVGALKWAKINWKYIQKEREMFIRRYLKGLRYNVNRSTKK